MEKENVHTVIIKIQNETRENVIILDEFENAQYRFGMPATPLAEKEWQRCLEAVQEIKDVSYIIASGSLPPGVPLNIYAQLSVIAKEKNAKFIVDACGETLREALQEGVYLLKPNLCELCFLAGKTNLESNEIETVAKEMLGNGKCEVMVVSMGAEGAMLVIVELSKIIKVPRVIKKSTVGAGDSMIAGIVHFLSQGKNIVDAVKYGVACGTAATMNTGTELCNVQDVEKIYTFLNN